MIIQERVLSVKMGIRRLLLIFVCLIAILIAGVVIFQCLSVAGDQMAQSDPGDLTDEATSSSLLEATEPDSDFQQISGSILIVSDNPGEVYLVTGDGQQRFQISDEDIHFPPPVLSPDGTRIAFRDTQGYLNIYDISTEQNDRYSNFLTNGSAPMGWSPAGDQIAFGCPDLPTDICVFTIETETIEKYTSLDTSGDLTKEAYTFAGWRSDGEIMGVRYYFYPSSSGSQTYGLATLQVLNVHSKEIINVLTEADLDDIARIRDVQLSPDGNSMLFSAKSGEYYAVYQINVDGTGLTRITPETFQTNITHPVWSPDGNAFIATVPATNPDSQADILLPTIFDLTGNVIGQINVSGGGEAASWVN